MNLLQSLVSFLSRLSRRRHVFWRAVGVVAVITWSSGGLVSLVSAWLSTAPPYPDPDQLFRVWETRQEAQERRPISLGTYLDALYQAESFTAAAYYFNATPVLGESNSEGSEPSRVTLLETSIHGPFLEVMGEPLFLGHSITDGDILISHRIWQRLLGSDPDVVGRSFRINGRPWVIAGVMAPGFHFPNETDVWFPQEVIPRTLKRRQRGLRHLDVIARKNPNVSQLQIADDLRRMSRSLAEKYPDTHGDWSMVHKDLHQYRTESIRPALTALNGAGVLLMLLGFANLTNMLATDLIRRRRELAIREALGASPWRITLWIMTETWYLCVLGGALGLAATAWTLDSLKSILPPSLEALGLGFSLPVFQVLAVVSIFGAGLGFLSYRLGARPQPIEPLRGGRSTPPKLARALHLSISLQVAFSLCVLITSGLMLQGFLKLAATDPGFTVEDRYILRFRWAQWGASEPLKTPHVAEPTANLITSLKGLDQIRDAALISHQPLMDPPLRHELSMPNDPSPAIAQVLSAGPNYLDLMNIAVLEGRSIEPEDIAEARPVIWVNPTFAAQLWPDGNALGRSIYVVLEGQVRTVVGIVADVRTDGLGQVPSPQAWVPFAQAPSPSGRIVLHLENAPDDLEQQLAALAAQIDPRIRVYDIKPLSLIVHKALPQPRLAVTTLGAMAWIALILTAVGLYAVVRRSMEQRRMEMAMRQALGASPERVLFQMLKRELRPVLWGLLVGLIGGIAAAHLFESLLYGIEPLNLITLSSTTLVLAVGAIAVILGPIFDAVDSPLDPLLREE